MEIKGTDFEKEVLESKVPVIVDFWGSWCPPCKMMEPVLEDLEKNYEKRAKIVKINIDQNPVITSKYEIKGVPTFILFKDGEIKDVFIGAQREEILKEAVDKLL